MNPNKTLLGQILNAAIIHRIFEKSRKNREYKAIRMGLIDPQGDVLIILKPDLCERK
jgi:hypothetical protein